MSPQRLYEDLRCLVGLLVAEAQVDLQTGHWTTITVRVDDVVEILVDMEGSGWVVRTTPGLPLQMRRRRGLVDGEALRLVLDFVGSKLVKSDPLLQARRAAFRALIRGS